MPWKPSEPGEVPTLGWEVLDWITTYLAAPDRSEYEPFVPTREQAQFILRYYELDPDTGKRRIRRGVISRPRGWGKSPFLAAIACAEAMAPVLFAGWNADGQPVGKPWSDVRTPLVQVSAVSESQTKNSWDPLKEMLDGPVIDAYPGLEVLDTFINLPRGRIEPVTSSARSLKGNKAVFAILDQTEEWVKSNGGHDIAEKLRINAAKLGGSTIESPNAFIPGEESVAEATALWVAKLKSPAAHGVLYDHREAPPETLLDDRESLMAGLVYTYGDSAEDAGGWVDLDRIIAEIWDASTDAQVARADFLNQITHASDQWITQPQWAACADATKTLHDGDPVTLGFDGSVRDDASALMACRIEDGHLELLHVDARPDPPHDRDWQVDREAMDQAVAAAMSRFRVVGFYCDPAWWQDYVDRWTSQYGPRMLVRSLQSRPLEWWTNRRAAMVAALERFHDATLDHHLSHDGDSILAAHVLNARNRITPAGYLIAKEHPHSRRKIDAAMASTLAYEARCDAIARGFGGLNRRSRKARAHGF